MTNRIINNLGATPNRNGGGRIEQAPGDLTSHYRAMIEQVPAVTYVRDLDRNCCATYVSPRVEAMLGYVPEEWLLGSEFSTKLLHPDDRERVLAENGVRATPECRSTWSTV